MADISHNNPNVFYELGIAFALKKPILPLCHINENENRIEKLKQYFGVDKCLQYTYFNTLKGKISSHLVDHNNFAHFKQLSGKSLTVIHDGNKIESTIKPQIGMKYTFSSLCISAAKSAIDQIFEDENIRQHPELNQYLNQKEDYQKNIVHKNLENETYDAIITSLKNSYCVLIDISTDNPAAFFWLGYIHAIGGFAIPINMVDSLNIEQKDEHKIAFDIRALWHIYFDIKNPIELERSLNNTLEFIFIEKSKNLHKYEFWDKIIHEGNKVSIFLGSLNIPNLDRNAIGDWDYRTAAELTRFLTGFKETIEVTLESLIQKSEVKPEVTDILGFEELLKNKNCIIIGSSDVNDLTEIALSKLFEVKPFSPFQEGESFEGFIPLKKYKDKNLKIPESTFFTYSTNEDPKRGFLFRYGKQKFEILEPHYSPEDKNANRIRKLLGLLIVARNPFSSQHWIVIICGISGPATLGIAQMLTGCIYSEFTVNKLKSDEESKFVKNWLNNVDNLAKWRDSRENLNINDSIMNGLLYPIDYSILSENKLERLNELLREKGFGIQALVSVGIYQPQKTQFHDERKIVLWNFTDIKEDYGYGKKNPSILKK